LIQVVDFHDGVVGSDHGPIVDGRSGIGIKICLVKIELVNNHDLNIKLLPKSLKENLKN
jgi:hypothetical protein